MISKRLFFVLLIYFFSGFINCCGTHLKGGEISIKRISNDKLSYEFTLTTYTEDNRANQDQTEVNFCFGDGSGIYKAKRLSVVNLGNGTLKNTYKIEYTYSVIALFYKVSVAIPNRNEGVRNITRSVEVPFYVETLFSVNPSLGKNSTPILLNPPSNLTTQIGQQFIYNPNALDAEGDSLAYRLTVSRYGDYETCNPSSRGIMAPNFKQPNEVSTTASSFTINSMNGDLIWDSPQELGFYNCAFIIEEWRDGIKISETVRDMQIEVKDSDNMGPRIIVPADVCVQAGSLIRETITAYDVASKTGRLDPVTITSLGNVYPTDTSYSVKQPYANFASTPNQTGTAIGTFSWQTDCQHIQKAAYSIFLKSEDNPPITNGSRFRLIDSKIWKIRVIAPKITGIKATVDSVSLYSNLSWDNYKCNLSNSKIIIYRKQSDKINQTVYNSCQTGMSLNGFEEIARLNTSTTSFVDNIDGNGLMFNKNYIYVFLVSFTNSDGKDDFSPMSELINLKNNKVIDCSNSQRPKLNTSIFTFCATDSLNLRIENNKNGDLYKWYFNSSIDSTNSINKTFYKSGKLFISKIDSFGCETKTDTLSLIKLDNIPIPSLSSLTSSILCNGQSVILKSSIDNVEWYLNGISIKSISTNYLTVNTPGIYRVKSISGNCSSLFSNSITVIESSSPSIPIVNKGINNELFVNNSDDKIQWYFNDEKIENATRNTFNPTKSGAYKVEITNSCGASMSSPFNFIITSIDENFLETLNVYPNPFSETININFSNEFGNLINVRIIGILGDLQMQSRLISKGEMIDLSFLKPGNYIIEINSSLGLKVKQIKINKI
ncbi:T9SS type A sorting domain-containing protein [Aquirufa nivalisilvae]